MFNLATDWNPKQAKLKGMILKPACFEEAIALTLEMHAFVHQKEVSLSRTDTFGDEVFGGISDKCFRCVTYEQGRTFAYNVWHSTRIEDICSNILIADDVQVINTNDWIKRINCSITDTGNALTADEIADFSSCLDREQLFAYRNAVGKKTREILRRLNPTDMKFNVQPLGLKRIIEENAVSTKEGAIWLLDYWGKKNVAGLILMPLTRHHVVHLNDCLKIKKKGSSL